MAASGIAEQAARAYRGRLVAYLAARTRDIAAAEDAAGDALRAALESWPRDGVPDRPEAWLLAVARRKLIDEIRRERARDRAADTLRQLAEEADEGAAGIFMDERLKLLFVCAHPAIDREVRTPLMLQTVLGLDAVRIAAAFLIAPAAMSQRLVRAKAKIRDAGIPFEVPERHELAARLDAVLEAVYAAYGAGWDDVAGADRRRRGLIDEALWLARLTVELLPDEAEAKGLLALMLHCEARRPARRTPDGAFVPLSEQDTQLWSRAMIDEAEGWLLAAARAQRIGRFQLEAAIQSAHAERASSGRVDWAALVGLYDALLDLAPGIGAAVGRAAAVAEQSGAKAALPLLQAIDPTAVADYQPYWALRAHLFQRLGSNAAAMDAYRRAIELTADPSIRDFLGQRAHCGDDRH